jgi:Ca-activated chloride channel family protein
MRGALFASLISFAAPAQGCEVALMLAVDVSGSVDADEYRIQMDGLAAGLIDRSVSAALISGDVKLALMQWTGAGRQTVVINWTEMASEFDVVAFAEQVIAEPRLWRDYSTAVGEAMALSLAYFAQVPECKRNVIDISGDGKSNEGRLPREIWDDLVAANVTVNALVIEESEPDLTAYFEREVIMGPGSFAMTANTFDDYPAQIVRKLYRELTKAVAVLDTQ